MIQRQRGDHDAGARALQRGPYPSHGLQQVCYHVAMGEHGGFGNAGGAAGILQKGQVVRLKFHRIEFQSQSARQCALETDGAGNLPGGHLLLHVTEHEIDDETFRQTEQVADAGDQDVFQFGVRQHFLQHMGKVFDDDDDLGARVLELMFEFACRVQRICIYYDHAGAQRAEQRHRVLQDIRHHYRDAVAFRKAGLVLQPGGERAAQLIELCVGERGAEVAERGQLSIRCENFIDHFFERSVLVGVDVRRHSGRIVIEPRSIHAGPFLTF